MPFLAGRSKLRGGIDRQWIAGRRSAWQSPLFFFVFLSHSLCFFEKTSTHPFVAPENFCKSLSSKHKTSAQYSRFTSNPAKMPLRTFRQNASYHECIKVGKRLMLLQCSPSFFPSLDVQPVSVTLCFHALFPPRFL